VALGFAIALACGAFVPAKADVMEELAPTGKLRVAIAVAPAPSALYAIKDEATGKYRGVTVELGSTIAKKLGVPVEFVPHLASGEIQNSADANRWDVTFMPVDANEKNSSTSAMPITCCKAPTLWRPARSPRKSRIQRIRRACRPCREYRDFATAPKATFVTVPGVDAAVAAIKAGEIDCIALSRESLSGLTAKITGSRVLDGGLLNSSTAVAVPKGKMEALAYVSQFIEDAKASGLVRKAFDDMDLKNSQVAPAGMKP
ncbi:MAG: transporter substrate-binding domain-containing protein, partial [Pseudolabrys sp.]